MSTSWRILAAVALLGTALVCLIRCDPPSTRQPAQDPTAIVSPFEELDRQRLRRQELDEHHKVVLRRMEGKSRVAHEVLAGRLTLLEAAARVRDLYAPAPEIRADLRRKLPGLPYEQALCREVISCVQAALDLGVPDPVGEVVVRLEAELAEHLQRHGAVRLPERAPAGP